MLLLIFIIGIVYANQENIVKTSPNYAYRKQVAWWMLCQHNLSL